MIYPSYATAQGRRPYQEDRFLIDAEPEGTLIGVFDGHGGDEVAQVLSEEFPKYWAALGGLGYSQALVKAFAMAHDRTQYAACGSTASVAFIPYHQSEVYVAVLGDSPVILERPDGSIWQSPEHNARSNQAEEHAAVQRGGIYHSGYMWNDYSDNAQGIQMTRAFGDYECRNFLDRTPEVFHLPLGNFLLVASDGLIDPGHTGKRTVRSVIDDIRLGQNPIQLVDRAVNAPTRDNVTAILWRRG